MQHFIQPQTLVPSPFSIFSSSFSTRLLRSKMLYRFFFVLGRCAVPADIIATVYDKLCLNCAITVDWPNAFWDVLCVKARAYHVTCHVPCQLAVERMLSPLVVCRTDSDTSFILYGFCMASDPKNAVCRSRCRDTCEYEYSRNIATATATVAAAVKRQIDMRLPSSSTSIQLLSIRSRQQTIQRE